MLPEDQAADLERENALLREELRHQWEIAHSEMCDWVYPHPNDQVCCWPPPAVLERRR